MTDFPWIDPDDPGYEVEPYDADRDAPPEALADLCGHE